MCSLTAVYLNQYIYQTAAAYCVCRFEWDEGTEGVFMFCKKRPFSFSSSLSHLLCILVLPSPFSPRLQPFSCPPITHRLKDHTMWSQHRPPLRLPPLASVSYLLRIRRVVITPWRSRLSQFFSIFSVFHNQCCCFSKYVGVGGIQMIFVFFVFLFLIQERRCVRAAFPHLGLTNHILWCPVLPLVPFRLSQPSSLLPSCPICLVCVHSVNHCRC